MSRMSQWLALYGKENLEMVRNAKWLWLPLVFIAIGVSQPITSYYTPQILESMGGLPDGAIISLPVPTAHEVAAQTLSQFGTLGLLVLVLAAMGLVSAERRSGVAVLIMIKPVPHVSYITAKWAGIQSLTLVSFACGYAASMYYTAALFGPLEAGPLAEGFAVYALWLMFIVTVTVFLSAWLRSAAGIASASIAAAALLSAAGGLLREYMPWNPALLASHAATVLTPDAAPDRLALCVAASLLLIALLLAGGVRLFRSRTEATG